MNSDTSKLISNLLGSVSISELTQVSTSEPRSDIFLITKKGSNDVTKTSTLDIFNYLTHRIFSVMATSVPDEESGLLDLSQASEILANYNPDKETKDLELIFGRFLYRNYKYKNQVCVESGGSISKVISDYFLPDFQYFYFENLTKQKRTMLIKYQETSNNFTISTTYWESNLEDQQPVTLNKSQTMTKNLVIPATCLSGGAFQRRNYIKIVKGGNTETTGEDVKFGNTREINENPDPDDSTPLGDIDATLDAIESYIGDYADVLINAKKTFAGEVLLTTATTSELNGLYDDSINRWDADIFDEKFIYANSGSPSTGGNNEYYLSDDVLPQHDHSEITSNIMIHGTPEGSEIGGTPVSDRVQSAKASTMNREKDSDKRHDNGNLPVINVGSNGPLAGTVVYDEKSKHQNAPMFYRVKILVRKAR